MSVLASHAAPLFTAYVFPALVSIILLGVGLAAIGIGFAVFRMGLKVSKS